MTKVGITGAAGYIGSRVMKRVLDEGYDVEAFDNFSDDQVRRVGAVDIREGDVRDTEDVRSFSDCDVVLHLGAESGVDGCEKDPENAFTSNIVGTENVLWFCRRERIPLVFPCSMAIIGEPTEFPITADHPRNPMNVYGFTKHVGEENVKMFAKGRFLAHIFMKSNVYGFHEIDGARVGKGTVINFFINRARAGESLTVYEPGTQARDFIHVKDVAEAYVKSVERLLDTDGTGSDTLEIASGRSVSVLDVAEMVADAYAEHEGERPEVKVVENPRAGSETLVENFDVDVSKAEQELGWTARHGLEESIAEMVAAK